MRLTISCLSNLKLVIILFASIFVQFIIADEDMPVREDAIDRDYVEALSIRYVSLGEGDFAPAYIDNKKSVIYIWREVSLKIDQVPNTGQVHRMPIIDLNKVKYDVKEITPIARYIVDSNGTILVGYYDHFTKIFFLWNGLVIKKPTTIQKTFVANKVDDDNIHKKINIPIPNSFLSLLFEPVN